MKNNIFKWLVISFLLSSFLMCKNTTTSKNELQGVWATSIGENASFWIKKDSIFYLDNFKSYKYCTKEDSIFIYYDNWIYKGTFKFRSDSLLLIDNKNHLKFIKITE